MTQDKETVRKMALDFAKKGEFLYSFLLTQAIGEKPVFADWKIKE